MTSKTEGRRLGAAFAKMMGRCPKTVAAYGACVREKIADGALERDACAREFAAMKKCFAEVRRLK